MVCSRAAQDQTEVSELYTEHFTQRVPDRCPYYKKGGGSRDVMWCHVMSCDATHACDMHTHTHVHTILGDTRYAQLTGISWHTKWENTCLLATAEGMY